MTDPRPTLLLPDGRVAMNAAGQEVFRHCAGCCSAAQGDDLPVALNPPRPLARVRIKLHAQLRRIGIGKSYTLNVDDTHLMDHPNVAMRPERCSAMADPDHLVSVEPLEWWRLFANFDAISMGAGPLNARPGMVASFTVEAEDEPFGLWSEGGFRFRYIGNGPPGQSPTFDWPRPSGGTVSGTQTDGTSTLDDFVAGVPRRFKFENWMLAYMFNGPNELEVYEFMVHYLDLVSCHGRSGGDAPQPPPPGFTNEGRWGGAGCCD